VGELRNHATRRSGSRVFRTSLEARSEVEKKQPSYNVLGFLLNNLYFNTLLNGPAQLHGVIFQTNGLLRQSVSIHVLTLTTPPIKVTADPRFGNPSLLPMFDFEQPRYAKLY